MVHKFFAVVSFNIIDKYIFQYGSLFSSSQPFAVWGAFLTYLQIIFQFLINKYKFKTAEFNSHHLIGK